MAPGFGRPISFTVVSGGIWRHNAAVAESLGESWVAGCSTPAAVGVTAISVAPESRATGGPSSIGSASASGVPA